MGSCQVRKAEDHMSKCIGQCDLTKQLTPRQLDEVIYNQIRHSQMSSSSLPLAWGWGLQFTKSITLVDL